MHIILGGTGNVGSVVADTLIAAGEPVTVVSRDADKAEPWRAKGARLAIVDILDVPALTDLFCSGKRAFLLNPPAAPESDTDRDELRTVEAMLTAIEGSGLEKVVAESTYGARPGDRCGDLNTLYALEYGLSQQPIPHAINRGAYYFTNWLASADAARGTGVLNTLFDADFALPMVAPADLGRHAATLMTDERTGTFFVEGPRRYTARDVADAFAAAFGRRVRIETTPRDQWIATFRALGFSRAAAESYARMTAATIDDLELPPSPVRGTTTLEDFLRERLEAREPA